MFHTIVVNSAIVNNANKAALIIVNIASTAAPPGAFANFRLFLSSCGAINLRSICRTIAAVIISGKMPIGEYICAPDARALVKISPIAKGENKQAMSNVSECAVM